ncbi:MAG TPA: hypothetical protein IGS37_15245 [Synechococcales cyanobacterium M55_K2018_004]|nr:hypothetical protein [Synechococcales cyanobacterium M55_K2018_004]
MNFRKLSGALLAATTVFTSTLPAEANPFQLSPAIFDAAPSTTTPATVGNTGNAIAPAATQQPSHPAAPASQVGNSEIQGLGDHQSWIDTGVLANDPRAMCSDVGLGNNTRSSSSRVAASSSTSNRSSESRTHNDQGGGGFNVFGIVGANGSGGSQGSQSRSASSNAESERTQSSSSSSSTVVVGRNCDAFVDAAARRDMNYQDNLTQRYRIRVERRGQQVDTLLTDR